MRKYNYPGASASDLLNCVRAMIAAALSDVWLPNKAGELVQVQAIRTYFDPENYENYDLPAVLIRFTGSSQIRGDAGEERVGTLEIVLGVFLEEYGDDEFAVSIMERIEQLLLGQRVVQGRYRLQLPLSWAVPERTAQPWPYWWATMTANYYLPAIAEVKDENEEPIEGF